MAEPTGNEFSSSALAPGPPGYATTKGHVPGTPSIRPTVTQPLSQIVASTRATRRRLKHPSLCVMGFLRGFETFGEAPRSLAGPPKRQQEQEHGEDDGSVAQRSPRPRAGGEPGQERGDHRRPLRQSSRRA